MAAICASSRAPLVQTSAPSLREESLGGCAALVRGQMLAKAGDGELSNIYREVTLADIDESGFVTDASRLVPDAAPLPPFAPDRPASGG